MFADMSFDESDPIKLDKIMNFKKVEKPPRAQKWGLLIQLPNSSRKSIQIVRNDLATSC